MTHGISDRRLNWIHMDVIFLCEEEMWISLSKLIFKVLGRMLLGGDARCKSGQLLPSAHSCQSPAKQSHGGTNTLAVVGQTMVLLVRRVDDICIWIPIFQRAHTVHKWAAANR
jgi:hypothetical protein